MKTSWYMALALAVFMAGCGKKKEATPTAQETNTPTTSGNPLTAPVDYLGALNSAQKTAVRVVDSTQIQRAIDMFNAQEDRNPKDLNELVTKHYLPTMPAPPRGMKFVYDAQAGKINIVREQP